MHVPAPDFFDTSFVPKLADATPGQLQMALASALGEGRLAGFKRAINKSTTDKIVGSYKNIGQAASEMLDKGVDASLVADIKKAFGRGRINI